MRLGPEDSVFKIEMELKYDLETGEMRMLLDNEVKQAVKIRQQMYDKVVIQAVIYELEQRGYTVLPPEGS